jgi:phage shock protein PspC (stress-responsive transcriptional regulator)
LWIVVPSQSLQSNVTKRLFRSSEDKVIGGVAGGLGAYFNMQTWIFRLIFALPFILGIISGIFHNVFWDWDFHFIPRFIFGGVGSSLFIAYIILWIAVPVATSATEKLEMRGEKVDLNSIASTVKEDLEGFKGRMEKVGNEFAEGAKRFGSEIKSGAEEKRKAFASEMSGRRNYNSGFGHVIGVLFKAFFLFIAGIIALALFGVLIALLFGGIAVFPLKSFILSGYTEDLMAWASLILFLGVPLVALITWLVRRIMGARSRNHYLGYVFSSLWVIGLVCTIVLISMFARNFRSRDFVEEDVNIVQPAKGKLFIDLMNGRQGHHYYSRDWFSVNWDNDLPIFGDNYDSLLLNTVRVNVVKSKDSAFHVERMKFSHGKNSTEAQSLARKINFEVSQQDSILLLPRGFVISNQDKFRNQQLLVVIEVPVGKRIEIDKSIDEFHWFTININRRRGWNIRDYDESDDNFEHSYGWSSNVEYVMTNDGLERTDNRHFENDEKKTVPKSDGGYRYKKHQDSSKDSNKKDSTRSKLPASEKKQVKEAVPVVEKRIAKTVSNEQISSPIYMLSTLFQ